MIVGVLLVELVFGAFLLLQKSQRSTADTDTDVATNSSAELAATSSQLADTHVTAGSVVVAAPLSGNTVTDPKQPASQSANGTVVTEASLPVSSAVQAPRLDTHTREPVVVHAVVVPKADPVPRTDSRRDSLHRHGSNPAASAITDELVKESAKLDPALPPPLALPSRNDPYRPGSNPVAAAMTDQLVRESAKLDPALPPPN
ncbi:hypothetical protein AYM40_34235 [Paraburkholderia phytofirmans OLGA172]|uniref:Extensin n=1 Tax=Paraburkholderia phytofirmans OLGA172 TaxID=1417228 RepID=A0A160FVV3_9BURK|nr:hypothetical protein AYM40_34235 [Paraburkholderia phytofirmans OLGA172]